MRVFMAVGLSACGAPQAPRSPQPTDVRCELTAVEHSRPVRVRVTLTNRGGSRILVGRDLDPLDADWIVDGRDGAARDAAAQATIKPPVELQFSGPTGENVPRALVIELAPKRTRSWTIDVVQTMAGSQRIANGVDISPMTLLAAALDAPGAHTLGLVVRPLPVAGSEERWEARCNPIEIEVQP